MPARRVVVFVDDRPSVGVFVPLAKAPRVLVELYAHNGDRKYERAALKYLRRCMDEANPSVADVAQVAALLAERDLMMRGL